MMAVSTPLDLTSHSFLFRTARPARISAIRKRIAPMSLTMKPIPIHVGSSEASPNSLS